MMMPAWAEGVRRTRLVNSPSRIRAEVKAAPLELLTDTASAACDLTDGEIMAW
jgi:hypothetical protein